MLELLIVRIPTSQDQNSNDSSSGPAPGTPNSQGMRPTPSPTGSTGSRSMSPAVVRKDMDDRFILAFRCGFVGH
uniref:Uncharacterized protein n=1 Tax=Timema monikensis TaxID=170555 RepID=A0A7R9DZA5_9NEOP|nr:unnamed protein product [Timema monikensis]